MLPIYIAKIEKENDGIYAISLVDDPAIEAGFMKFKNEKISLSITDADQHIILGPVMRANFPIYRYNEQMGEYYIKYTPEVIIEMSKKLLSDNTFNNISLMHNGENISGVKLMQLFIKDTNKGIDPIGFESIEDGSLFAEYKIEDEELWQKIKSGEFLGFSLEGWFSIDKEQIDKNTKYSKMIKSIFKFMQNFVQLGSVETDKAILYWAGTEDLKAGDAVFTDGEDGGNPVEDGEYITKDGKAIIVKDGKVEAINDPEAEVDGKDEKPEEKPEEKKEEKKEEPKEEKKEEEQKNEDVEKDNKEIEDLKTKLDELTAKYDELVKKIEKLEGTPAGETLDDKFNKQISKNKTGKIQLIY